MNLVVCPNCQQKTLPHMACRSCGFYAGKKATDKTQVRVVKA
jgi:ribosomal protein L32